MAVFFDAVTSVVFDNLALRFGNDSIILRFGVLFLFVIIIVGDKNRPVVARDANTRKQSGLSFARLGIHDLNNLVKTYRAGSNLSKARQNRSDANGRE